MDTALVATTHTMCLPGVDTYSVSTRPRLLPHGHVYTARSGAGYSPWSAGARRVPALAMHNAHWYTHIDTCRDTPHGQRGTQK